MANYSLGMNPLPQVENGHTFTGDNFTQMVPHTKIFEGLSNLKFVNCNLTNCDPPVDSVFVGCKPSHVSFCSNLHPKYLSKGLTVCGQNCAHLVDIDTITIDGVIVDTIYEYEDKGVL